MKEKEIKKRIPACSGVYLIRLDQPLGNEKHKASYYLGSSSNIKKRFIKHKNG